MGASRFFEERGIRAPLFNAEVLVQHVLGLTKARMLFEWQNPFPEAQLEEFLALAERRGRYEPLQYLTGSQDFFGRTFEVTPHVLIPRPETEILIEEVLKQRPSFQGRKPRLVDIGTGSGAIAITLALEWPELDVTAIDLSPEALAVAKRNSERLGAAEKITFLQGDLIQPLLQGSLRPDLIISNPPYIPSADCEELDAEVRDHEPRLALDGGADGLNPYRVITGALPQLWPESGPAYVAFEVGIHQDRDVEAMIAAHAGQTGIVPDWQNIGRVVWGRR